MTGNAPPADDRQLLRIGRERVPQPAGDGDRRDRRNDALPRLVERMVRGSGTSRRARSRVDVQACSAAVRAVERPARKIAIGRVRPAAAPIRPVPTPRHATRFTHGAPRNGTRAFARQRQMRRVGAPIDAESRGGKPVREPRRKSDERRRGFPSRRSMRCRRSSKRAQPVQHERERRDLRRRRHVPRREAASAGPARPHRRMRASDGASPRPARGRPYSAAISSARSASAARAAHRARARRTSARSIRGDRGRAVGCGRAGGCIARV